MALIDLYKVDDIEKITDFLQLHPELIEVLNNTYNELKKIFVDDEYFSIEIDNFPTLWITINTNKNAYDASALLTKFDFIYYDRLPTSIKLLFNLYLKFSI